MISPSEWLKTYNHLGSFYPYYCYGRNSELYISISSAIENIPSDERLIDPVAIAEFVTKSYVLADRTLVQNISRTPWMARPNGQGGWEYAELPEHGFRRMPANEIAQELKSRLLNEAIGYLQGKSQVGILLSGGMDSRMLAGVIRELQLKGDWNGQVIAFTWGLDGSRDVKYAEQIARMFSWEWVHLKLDAEALYNNIFIAAEMGAEFAPHHLHAMPKVASYQELNAVLAVSYGDSVGRAEFSGTHLLNQKPILQVLQGRLHSFTKRRDFWVIRSKIFREVKEQMVCDAYSYRQSLGLNSEYHNYCEIELEMHYMRRKLQAPMSYMGMRVPLYQLFTAPETFAFMWNLDPQIRDDSIYAELIQLLPGDLAAIPWARTGVAFGVKKRDVDNAPKEYHQYGIWLRHDLRDFIQAKVLSDTIMKLGIFNEQTLVKLVKLWPHSKTITTNAIDEIVSWLATLAIFVEKYNIKSPYRFDEANVVGDFLSSIYGNLMAWLYQEARERVRD